MGRQNFIDRWVDNKSYQYSLSIFILVDPGKVNFSEFAIRRRRAANLAVVKSLLRRQKGQPALGCPSCSSDSSETEASRVREGSSGSWSRACCRCPWRRCREFQRLTSPHGQHSRTECSGADGRDRPCRSHTSSRQSIPARRDSARRTSHPECTRWNLRHCSRGLRQSGSQSWRAAVSRNRQQHC